MIQHLKFLKKTMDNQKCHNIIREGSQKRAKKCDVSFVWLLRSEHSIKRRAIDN